MTPIPPSMMPWCLAGSFALLQVFVSLEAVGHAMEHLQHEATPHATAACAWFHVAGESLEAAAGGSPCRFLVVTAVEPVLPRPLSGFLSFPRCSRSPPDNATV
jgi:hypothetical protein